LIRYGWAKKSIKPWKPEKNNWKNWIVKNNRLEFWKNQPVRFRFYKPKTEKTELNPNRRKTEPNWKKPSKNRKNRAKQKKPSQIGLNRFFPKNNRTEPKLVGLNRLRFLLKKNRFLLLEMFTVHECTVDQEIIHYGLIAHACIVN
jgi:hypothetical protein